MADDRPRGRASERRPPGNKLEHRECQRVDVRCRARLRALYHFRREVGDRPQQVLRLARRHGSGQRLGNTEVRDLRLPRLVYEDVLGLDVAVDNAFFVRVLESSSDLDAVADRFAFWKPPLRLQELAQRVAVHVLHDNELAAFVRTCVINSHDAGVLQTRDHRGFTFERRNRLRIDRLAERFAERFDRDPATQPLILRQPDFSHTPGTEQAFETVSSIDEVRRVQMSLNPSEVVARERNIELAFILGGLLFIVLALRSLDAAAFPVPSGTTRIVTQFALSALAGNLALRFLAPRSSAQVYAIACFLAAVGLAFVIRLAPASAQDQVNWISVGIAAFAAFCWLGRHANLLTRYTYTAGAGALGLLVLTGLFGTTINGARLWVVVAGQTIQTTELIKLLLVVFLAGYLSQHGAVLATPRFRIGQRSYSNLPYLVPLIGLLFAAVAALALLKDLGSIALLVLLSVAMLYVATGRARYLAWGALLLVLTAAAGYFAFDHARVRIDTWLDPGADPAGAGYQTMQATYAIQAGGITGEGLGLGEPDAIPAAVTDYVFSAVAEELGLAGATALVLLYLALLYAGLRASLIPDDANRRYLCAGVAMLIAIQAAVIIAGNLRLIPTTGITLPFVSYGGSSLVVNFALIGLLLGASVSDQPEPS